MPTYSRLAVKSVEASMDSTSAVSRAREMFRTALGSGRVTGEDIRALLAQLDRAYHASLGAVVAAERAEFSERAVVAGLTGEVPHYFWRQARELGLRMVVVIPGGVPDEGTESEAA